LFFSCRLGCEKPDPAFYRKVQSHIGVEPGDILFLDDKPVNVEAARALGWNAEVYLFGDPVRWLVERCGLAPDA
jgi:putative hydrolase of the HAD superfamily